MKILEFIYKNDCFVPDKTDLEKPTIFLSKIKLSKIINNLHFSNILLYLKNI